ncbi:DAK2 domain-containing protein [Conexibacter sp. CPCC 206217]|uniref:DAK2 domain-containing protein n=1 Tax=Conexibacter sp. CPCC 206217 TaxID=3064574 RepID=UPI002716E663|nr:DAK2 domain-containing protein [Conexibacter sp. CPCC 206217]MDO8213134.1 DAK2 domain-containing protein [Conexibacter sp. CPCC 206217]
MGTIDATAWVERFLVAAEAHRAQLGDLDRQAGDGDFGTNLETSLRRAREELSGAGGQAPFAALSTAFLNTGGTSGPLYGMWFRALAQAADAGPLDARALGTAVAAGTDAVCRLGGAAVGDKTMVDAMRPAADALLAASEAGEDVARALAAAATAARRGADATAAMLARRGRSSYVGEVARGVLDPGAVTVAIFFEAAPGPDGGAEG